MTDESVARACAICKSVKPIEKFSVTYKPTGLRNRKCNQCRAKAHRQAFQENPERLAASRTWHQNWGRKRRQEKPDLVRSTKLKYEYGITLEQKDEMLAAQGGCCAICATDKPNGAHQRFVVDHCHDTGRVRGILCHACNVALGGLGDTVESVERAVLYLKGSHQ